MGMTLLSELEYINSLEKADTDDNFEQFEPVLTRAEEALMTPLVGEIKAISELPNDLAYARELVKSGYDENDLRQMGLGGAYSVLSVMGIVPGIRVGAKVAKKSFKEIMDEELAKDVKPEPPKVDTPPKEILPSETTEEFLQKREKSSSQETAKRQYGLMSKR
jgi:hypothetical protein